MPVTDSFRAFVIDQLEHAVREIRWKRMFGGVGIYCGEYFFALISDDRLYFKVDDETRPKFEADGMEPFRPSGDHGEVMSYYEVPLGADEHQRACNDKRQRVCIDKRQRVCTDKRQWACTDRR